MVPLPGVPPQATSTQMSPWPGQGVVSRGETRRSPSAAPSRSIEMKWLPSGSIVICSTRLTCGGLGVVASEKSRRSATFTVPRPPPMTSCVSPRLSPSRGGPDGLAGPDVEQGPIDERPGADRRVHARAEEQALVGRAGQGGDPVGMADLEYHLGPGRLDAEVEFVLPEAQLRGHSAPGLEALESQPGVLLELLEALGQAVPMRRRRPVPGGGPR